MGRFSPQVRVYDRSGEILAAGLQQAFANFMQGRRQRRLDTEREEDRRRARAIQDAQLAKDHIRLTAPGEVPRELSNIANNIDVSPGALLSTPDWGAQARTGGPLMTVAQTTGAQPSLPAVHPTGEASGRAGATFSAITGAASPAMQTLEQVLTQSSSISAPRMVNPRSGPAVQMGDGWIRDMDAVRGDAKAAREREQINRLTNALLDAQVFDIANPGKRERDAERDRIGLETARTRLDALRNPTPEPARMGQVLLDTGKYAWNPTTGTLGPRLGNAPRPTPRASTSNDAAYRSHMLRRMGELTRGRGTPGRVGYVAPLSEQDARDKAQREWDAVGTAPQAGGARLAPEDEQAVGAALQLLRSGEGSLQQLEQSGLSPHVKAAVRARLGQQ